MFAVALIKMCRSTYQRSSFIKTQISPLTTSCPNYYQFIAYRIHFIVRFENKLVSIKMAQIPITRIIEELVKDEILIIEKTQFAQALDTPTSKRVQWEGLFTMGISSGKEHFTKLLEDWVHRIGREARLGKIREILTSCDFIAASGKFEGY